MAAKHLAVVFAVVLSVAAPAHGAGASPVQKVLQLIEEMQAKVQDEGQAATDDFEQFAKWCDDEADDKDRSIKESLADIQDLEATIAQGSATIDNLATKIEDLATAISGTEKELADATASRANGKKVFQAAEEELVGTVETLGHDAQLIKQSMGGGGSSLLQTGSSTGQQQLSADKLEKIHTMLDSMRRIVESGWVSTAARGKVQAFLQQRAEEDDAALQQPQAFQSSSDGIIGTINSMEEKAGDSLSEERKQEMKDQNAFELLKMALSNEIADLKEQMEKAKSRKQFTAQELASAEKSLAGAKKGLAEDQSYLADLKHDCQVKAGDYEEEYKDRANELAALGKAKAIMSDKFSFLQTSSTTRLRSRMRIFDERKQAALQMIHRLGKKYGSTVLVSLSYRALADPFAKVKGMIEEMIAKLLQEASEEADHKAFCDKELGETEASKDGKTEKLATVNSRMGAATSASSKLAELIKLTSGEVSEIDAAMAEATKMRSSEKVAFEKASKEYSESQDACAAAVEVLRSYYESGAAAAASFVQLKAQTRSKVRVRSRTQMTTRDGSGIIGMLEVAESDFSKLLAEARAGEDNAQSEFTKMAQDNKVVKATKNAEIKAAETELASTSTTLENFGEDKDGLTKELAAVTEYLDKLKPQCANQAPSYAERKARREKEIDGLKEALTVLEGDGVPMTLL